MKKIILIALLFISASAFEITKVVSVYDGDTFKVNLNCSEPLFCENIPVRVYGIDTPEKRTKSENEKKLSLEARDFTKAFVKNATLEECVRGKYFRIVCKVKNNNLYLHEELIKHRLGVFYDGGTKSVNWDTWKKENNESNNAER